MYKLDNKTHIGQVLAEKMMSDTDRKILEELEYQKELDEFENDDF